MNDIPATKKVLGGALAFLLTTSGSSAHEHDKIMPAQLGQVYFQNSCSADVQGDIDKSVSLLYSFWYDEARKSFINVSDRDPECAIAFWGEAMTYYQQVEGLPSRAALAAGQIAIAKARAAPRKTAREQRYIDALGIIYNDTDVLHYDARAQRYADAMGLLSRAYPSDHEAAVFYALSLLSPDLPEDLGLRRSREALTILNEVLKAEPDNPGVIHYIIHASDNPQMATLGLAAARRYAQIAPSSAHALHMPAHIFARLGLWTEDIRSNLASKAVAERHSSMHIGAENRLHAMEFLQYAYLQIGRDDKARAIIEEARAVVAADVDPGYEDYYPSVEAYFPARLALETRDWASALEFRPAVGAAANVQRIIYWAQAVAAGHLRDRQAAENAASRYRLTMTSSQWNGKAGLSPLWSETRAWLEFAKGNTDGATALLRPVADREDKIGKGEVELPPREMMGDMLRLANRPAEALQEYRVSLRTDPGRFNTLLHAGEMAETLGRDKEAASDYRLLLRNATKPSPKSDGALSEARAFLSLHETM